MIRSVGRKSKIKHKKIDQLIIKSDISIHKNLNLHILLGYQYIGASKDDSLCRYVADEFDRLFEQAQNSL